MQQEEEDNLLTVLLITYNHKDYFVKSIESVLAQKTSFPFQIYIVDDASTDGTSDIVRDYASRYPDKIKAFIRKVNFGVIENIYQGILSIKTKYFATLESDDCWCDETKLQLQVEALEHNPDCSFCAHDCKVNNPTQSDAAPRDGETLSEFYKENICSKIGIEDVFRVHTSTRLFRRDCIDLKCLKQKESVVFDYCSYYYYLSKGKLYYIDKVMSEYNCTGTGWFSSCGLEVRLKTALKAVMIINEELNFRYDAIFFGEIVRLTSKKTKKQLRWWKLFFGTKCAYKLFMKKLG